MTGLLVLMGALGAGLVGAVFFAFSTFVMPALARLPAVQGIAAMQSINVTVINRWFLGVFVGTAFASLVIALWAGLTWSSPGARLAFAAALLYLFGNILVTRVFNIPRNDALAAVSPVSVEAAELWRRYLVEWCFWNHVRGVASFGASALFIVSLIHMGAARRVVAQVFGAALAIGGLTGCNLDQARPLAAPGTTTPVERLSALGVFEGEVREQRPTNGFVPYDVNVAFYSDGATKRRFVHVPPGKKVHITADRWELPVGTYLVKSFSFPVDPRDPSRGERLVETRFLLKTEDGFVGSTYLWNAEQTDAFASAGNVDVRVGDRVVHVPGTSECTTCHEGRALGWRSRQLDAQVAHLVSANVAAGTLPAHGNLVNPLGDAPLALRARSYLDVNCGACHTAGGSAERTGVFWDLEHTATRALLPCGVIAPGHPERTAFLARMATDDRDDRMPRGPNLTVDRAGYDLLAAWVAAMPAATCVSSSL